MSDTEVAPAGRIANIEKAMEVLEALSSTDHGLTVGDLTKALRISKSAASRIIATLHRDGYVARDPYSGRFRLALKLMALAARYADRLGVEQLCGPLLRELADETGELIQMALIEENEMRYLARAEGSARVRVVSILGQQVVPHAFAAGKLWLAHMPMEAALKIALDHGLERLTPRTIVDVKALQHELSLTAERDYALNLEEVDVGVNSIAVPIRLPGKVTLVGALALTAPSYRLPAGRLMEHCQPLHATAKRLGECLLQSPIASLIGRG